MSPPILYAPARLDAFPAPTTDETQAGPDNLDSLAAEWIDRLAAISPVEADIIDLFRLRKTPEDIAIVLEMSRQCLAYRYARALRRLAHIRWLDSVRLDVPTIQRVLEPLVKPEVAEVVITAWVTLAHAIEVAALVGIPQGTMGTYWARALRCVRIAVQTSQDADLHELHRWMTGHRWRLLQEERTRPRWHYSDAVVVQAREVILDAIRHGGRTITQLIRAHAAATGERDERLVRRVVGELEGLGQVRRERRRVTRSSQ